MSQGQDDDGGLIRTVTKPYRSRTDEEMNLIGLLYGLGLVLVLIPLLPFIALIWASARLRRAFVGADEPS